MAKFFIHRPIFAWVIAIVIMLGGALAISTLSISQYPDIAPTTVRINATYSGASAETVEKSVTSIIEDGMTGLDDLSYMTSSSSTGQASVTLTFGNSIEPDIAQVQVQNKLQLVQSQLPDIVQSAGISVTRSTSSILLVGALVSTDAKRSRSNSATSSQPRSKTRSNASKASAASRCSAPATPCASGSTPSSSTSSS